MRNIVAKLKYKINQISEIDNKLKNMEKLMPLPTLQFEVHLTEHCNLNCRGCNNFSCIAEPSFLDVEQYKKDLQRLSDLCEGEAKRINLMGGEPLLHPDVAEIARLTREKFPRAIINVFTNGLLLLNQPEQFWSILKENNVGILVTPYPISFDYTKAEEIANRKGVAYQYCIPVEEVKGLCRFVLDLKGQQNEKESFMKCVRANCCIFLKNGKLYTCTLVPNIEHFNRYFDENLPVTRRDYIDIYETDNLQEILDFLARPIPFCRFCDIDADTKLYPWGQTKKEKSEWT